MRGRTGSAWKLSLWWRITSQQQEAKGLGTCTHSMLLWFSDPLPSFACYWFPVRADRSAVLCWWDCVRVLSCFNVQASSSAEIPVVVGVKMRFKQDVSCSYSLLPRLKQDSQEMGCSILISSNKTGWNSVCQELRCCRTLWFKNKCGGNCGSSEDARVYF